MGKIAEKAGEERGLVEKASDLRKLVQAKYGIVLRAAKEGERRCLEGRRWSGNALLIVIDTALDSIGLNYFQIVVPRVRRFLTTYVKTGKIVTFRDFLRLKPWELKLKEIMNNERVWQAAIGVCDVLERIRRENRLETDFSALRFWAERADYKNWKADSMGKVPGIGLVSFQYLRMQAGIKTAMPDRIIKRAVKEDFGVEAKDDFQFIEEMRLLSELSGYSEILLCWAIWLKRSDVKNSSWEDID